MLVGSCAIKYHFSDFLRKPKDCDLIAFDEYDKLNLIKIHNDTFDLKLEVLINPVLLNWYKEKNEIPQICDKDELYTLKVSHSFWSLDNGSWEKHLWDIQWLKEKGCKLIEPLFWKLFNYWNEIFGERTDSFEKTKRLGKKLSSDDFFNNAINYNLNHDDLHNLLIKHEWFNNQIEPTYKKILKNNEEVDICMVKFNNLSEEDKFKLIFEEIAVMSFEPRFPKDMFWKQKYNLMLKNFILKHCTVEQGMWIIQNHKKLLNIPFNFEKHLNSHLK